MSMSKIRKVDTSQTPPQARSQYGPATAGVEYNTVKKAVEVNPDGTFAQLGMVHVEDAVPDATDTLAPGTLWIRATGPTLYINLGTAASPDWNTITQS